MFHIINFEEEIVKSVIIYDDKLVIDYYSYKENFSIDDDNFINANCCCYECSEKGIVHGHFLCSTAFPDVFLELEEDSFLFRDYREGGWRWIVNQNF